MHTYIALIKDDEANEVGQVMRIKEIKREGDKIIGLSFHEGLIDIGYVANRYALREPKDIKKTFKFNGISIHWYDDGKYYEGNGDIELRVKNSHTLKLAFNEGEVEFKGEVKEAEPFPSMEEDREVLPERADVTLSFY